MDKFSSPIWHLSLALAVHQFQPKNLIPLF
jgi:hypothetical protein